MINRVIPILVKSLLIMILFVSILVVYNMAAPIRLKTNITGTSAYIGDRIGYSIEIIANKDIEVNVPEIKDDLSGFEILEQGVSKDEFLGKTYHRRWYVISSLSPGDYVIPGIVVEYDENGLLREIVSKDLNLTVKTVLTGEEKSDFTVRFVPSGGYGQKGSEGAGQRVDAPIWFKIEENIRPFGVFTRSDAVIILLAAGAFLIVGVIVFWLIKFKKRHAYQKASPYELAFKRLSEIDPKKTIGRVPAKEIYYGLSSILSDYIKTSFNLTDQELTTRELILRIERIKGIPVSGKESLKKLLSLCDLVKFSDYKSGDSELNSSFTMAGELIRKIAVKK